MLRYLIYHLRLKFSPTFCPCIKHLFEWRILIPSSSLPHVEFEWAAIGHEIHHTQQSLERIDIGDLTRFGL